MTHLPRNFAALAALAAGLLPMTAVQAQYYGAAPPPPLYPYGVQNSYGVQNGQPYAVQVAPNTYVIQRPVAARNYPYVRCQNCGRRADLAPGARRFDRPHKPADRGLIEELRKRAQAQKEAKESQANNRDTNTGTVINTTKIVRDPPVVVQTQRVVDDPPRVIERRQIVEDQPSGSRRQPPIHESGDTGMNAGHDDGKARVIQADAEVTILGPDRMSIRLFRKGHGPKADAPTN